MFPLFPAGAVTAMPKLSFLDTAPTPEDYNRLRQDAGWPEMDPTVAAQSLAQSCFAICAYNGSELVGMGRVVGDFGLCFYIQDVVVLQDHQGSGVGDAIMRRIMKFISEHAVENTYVGLMSAVGKEAFYLRYGFVIRPTESLGAGMTLFWGASSQVEEKETGGS